MELEKLSASLSEAISKFEEEEMGVRPAETSVLVQEDLVMVHLKGVLSPSEQALARTDVGQAILQRFNNLLFNAGSCPSVREQISSALEREVVDVQTTLSPLTGSLVVVFSLGQVLEA